MKKTAGGKLEWMSRDNNPIILTVTVDLYATPHTINADGDIITTSKTDISESITYQITFNSQSVGGDYRTYSGRTDGVVASIGKVGLLADRKKIVADFVDELKNNLKKDFPEFLKGEAEEAAREKQAEENCKANAKLYADRIASGMCPKCQSWCYGDCGAN